MDLASHPAVILVPGAGFPSPHAPSGRTSSTKHNWNYVNGKFSEFQIKLVMYFKSQTK